MSDASPPRNALETALGALGDAIKSGLESAGNVMAAQTALAQLMQGDRPAASRMIDSMPDDAIQPAMDAALTLAGLLLLKGRGRGLDIPDPLPGHALTQDHTPPA